MPNTKKEIFIKGNAPFNLAALPKMQMLMWNFLKPGWKLHLHWKDFTDVIDNISYWNFEISGCDDLEDGWIDFLIQNLMESNVVISEAKYLDLAKPMGSGWVQLIR